VVNLKLFVGGVADHALPAITLKNFQPLFLPSRVTQFFGVRHKKSKAGRNPESSHLPWQEKSSDPHRQLTALKVLDNFREEIYQSHHNEF
jgi:hypothetical protein